MPLTDEDLMPFGQYQGTKLKDVPASYLLFLMEREIVDKGPLKNYILDNMKVLEKEASESKYKPKP